MALALPFSLSFLAMLPATFGVACLLSALVRTVRRHRRRELPLISFRRVYCWHTHCA